MWKAFNRISEKIENVKVRIVARNFPRGVPASVKNCRLCGSFFSPVLPSSHFFSKGCAWAPFEHSLATPLVKLFMTEVEPDRIFVSDRIEFRDVSKKQFFYMLIPRPLKNSWELLYPSRTCSMRKGQNIHIGEIFFII